MKLRMRDEGRVTVVTIEGNVMQEYVSVFRSRLSELIERGRVHIVLEMAESAYISSLCLAVIIDAKNQVDDAGGDIRIAGASKLVQNLLEITNLYKKVPMHATVEEAVEALQG